MTAVVKKAIKEKVGKRSDYVVIFYVNRFEYPLLTYPVEKGCGKVCGECGKVRVFNRYFGSLEFFNTPGGMHIPVHTPYWQIQVMALCRRCKPEFSSETLAKKLAIFIKEGNPGGDVMGK